MPRRLKMKDLERATGVSREAIRFYIREGLLPEPERPARNVAWYDESFVERIRTIKRLQQQRYLPLSVIKEVVGEDGDLSRDEVQTLLDLDGEITPPRERDTPHPPETLTRLAKRIGLSVREIRKLADVGLVEVVTHRGRPSVEGTSVAILERWALLRRSGFEDELGFGPELAMPYVEVVRWIAEEGLRLFTRRVTGRVDRDRARDMARLGVEHMSEILALLHERTLVRLIAKGGLDAATATDDSKAS